MRLWVWVWPPYRTRACGHSDNAGNPREPSDRVSSKSSRDLSEGVKSSITCSLVGITSEHSVGQTSWRVSITRIPRFSQATRIGEMWPPTRVNTNLTLEVGGGGGLSVEFLKNGVHPQYPHAHPCSLRTSATRRPPCLAGSVSTYMHMSSRHMKVGTRARLHDGAAQWPSHRVFSPCHRCE